jgi:hypothetical protein
MRFLIPDANFLGAPDAGRAAACPDVGIDAHRHSPPERAAPKSAWRVCDAIILHAERREGVLRNCINLDWLDRGRVDAPRGRHR